MHSGKLNAPGLRLRRNRDGTVRLYWVAKTEIVRNGFLPKSVRLHYDHSDLGGQRLIEAACCRMQAEMLAWQAGFRETRPPFDGTLGDLVRLYQTNPASPYFDLKHNTRETYDQVLRIIVKAFGPRNIDALSLADFKRWYEEAKRPKAPGGQERVRRAHGIISMLRRLFSYGVAAEHEGCGRLVTILDATRFKQPKRRRIRMERHHVEAFIPKAIEMGRLSLALGTALQFETGMRQKDVIGEWEPNEVRSEVGGIMLRGKRGKRMLRWVNGLTWADIASGPVLIKETTKTGAMVAHDLSLCPMTQKLIASVPLANRIGPLIIDENSGRPYAKDGYAREWRVVARAAGVPDEVWNMDARAGAITEAEDAGADLDTIRGAVGHSQASTTARYSRGALGKSRQVAQMRQANRTSVKDLPTDSEDH